MRWWWWIVFVVWLTHERRLVLFPAGTISEILTIVNLRHAASRIWSCAEHQFRFSWMKLCSSDNYYSTVPRDEAFVLRKKHQHSLQTLPSTSIGIMTCLKGTLNGSKWYTKSYIEIYYRIFFRENSYGKISLPSIAQKDWQGLMNVLGNKTTVDRIKQFTSVQQWATFTKSKYQ